MVSVELWKALQELKDDEFKKFKWLLKQDDISVVQLEKADRQDTVDLMAQKYGGPGAVEKTMKVLETISRTDLVQGLQKSCPEPKDLTPLDLGALREYSEGKMVAVDESLDPKTTHSRPIGSGYRDQVHFGVLFNNPERLYRCVCWSGKRIDQQQRTNHNES